MQAAANDLKKRWKWDDPIVVQREDALEGIHLSEADRDILLHVGFPEEPLFCFDYSHLPDGLPWVEVANNGGIPGYTPGLPTSVPKRKYRVLGKGIPCYPDICIDIAEGALYRLLEEGTSGDYVLQFVNSNIYCYWDFLCIVMQESVGSPEAPVDLLARSEEDDAELIQKLQSILTEMDPEATSSEDCYWPCALIALNEH